MDSRNCLNMSAANFQDFLVVPFLRELRLYLNRGPEGAGNVFPGYNVV